MHAQVHDPRADGEHVPDRVARRSSRSRRPLESGDRETPNLCGEAKGVEFTLETRQMEQVRVMPHRLHMRRACGLGSNSSVLRSRLRSRRLSKGGCAAASALLSAGGEHASTESMPLCDILVYWRLLSFHKKKIGPHFHHTSTRGVPSLAKLASAQEGLRLPFPLARRRSFLCPSLGPPLGGAPRKGAGTCGGWGLLKTRDRFFFLSEVAKYTGRGILKTQGVGRIGGGVF